MDIAALGLSVDSGPAERAVNVLRQLPGAARQAAAGADQLAGAAEREAHAVTQSTATLGANARAAQVAGSAMRAANQNIQRSGGLARWEMINLSRQVQDIGVSLASGQSPFTVLVQQGTQVGDIFASTNGTLRGFASQIAAVITPMRALALGIGVVGAAAYGAVSIWKSYSLALDDLSSATGIAFRDLSKLQSAASFKGISSDEFASGMQRFSSEIYRAKSGTNDLAKLFAANHKTIGDTASSWGTFAELIRNARDDQQRLSLLQQGGLSASMEWVRLLRDGKAGLEDLKALAVDIPPNEQAIQQARQFDETLNRIWTNAKAGIVSWGSDVVSAFNAIYSDPVTKLVIDVLSYKIPAPSPSWFGYGDSFSDRFGGIDSNTNTAASEALRRDAMSRYGLSDQAAGAGQIRLPGVTIDPREMAEQNKKATDRLKTRQSAISVLGAAATEAEKYEERVRVLNKALGDGILNQEQYNRALAYADPLFSGIESTLSSGLTSALTDMASGTKSAKDAFTDFALSAAKSLEQLIIKLTIIDPLMKSLAGIWGGGGGSPLSILPSWLGSAKGNVFDAGNVMPFAHGGIIGMPAIFPMANGGVGLMGEAGPEAIMPLRRTSGGRLGVEVAGGREQQNTSFAFGETRIIIQGNADSKAIAQIKSELAEHRKAIAQQVRQARSSNHLSRTGVGRA